MDSLDIVYCSGLVSVDNTRVKPASQHKRKTSGQTFQYKSRLPRLFVCLFLQKIQLSLFSWLHYVFVYHQVTLAINDCAALNQLKLCTVKLMH